MRVVFQREARTKTSSMIAENNTVVLILSDVDADIDHNKNHLSQLRYAVTHGLFAYGTSIDINCRAVSDSSPFKQKAVAGSFL